MKKNKKSVGSIDEYIRTFPKAVGEKLNAMRKTIQAAAPEAEERISYQVPTLFLEGNLVHFAAFKNHIGFFPEPSAILAFKKELSAYATTKGGVQFPLDKPLPLALVARIVNFRVTENLENHQDKLKKK
jgi:uncharacterized protein YdhG (YjbR/CyaY superfamily)